MGLERARNIADLREMARKRLPRMVFDYIDGGAEREITMRENSRAFDDVVLRPRCAVATDECDLRTTVLGTSLELPFLLAPVGSSPEGGLPPLTWGHPSYGGDIQKAVAPPVLVQPVGKG